MIFSAILSQASNDFRDILSQTSNELPVIYFHEQAMIFSKIIISAIFYQTSNYFIVIIFSAIILQASNDFQCNREITLVVSLEVAVL